jgi:hypothetical protein
VKEWQCVGVDSEPFGWWDRTVRICSMGMMPMVGSLSPSPGVKMRRSAEWWDHLVKVEYPNITSAEWWYHFPTLIYGYSVEYLNIFIRYY